VLDGGALGEKALMKVEGAKKGDAGLLVTHAARDEFVDWAARATGLRKPPAE